MLDMKTERKEILVEGCFNGYLVTIVDTQQKSVYKTIPELLEAIESYFKG